MKSTSSLGILSGGILAMIMAMGIGRFAYTPLLPLMQADLGFSDSWAGGLASANYLGYLLGALQCSTSWGNRRPLAWMRSALVLNLALTTAMGLWPGLPLWLLLRFASGWSSALVFILCSEMVMSRLVALGKASLSGWLHGGIGLGIVLTGLSVPLLAWNLNWQGAWVGLGLVGLLALPLVFGQVKPLPRVGPPQDGPVPRLVWWRGFLAWLGLAYFLEGLGYVVTATFLSSLIQRNTGWPALAAGSWMLVGLAAFPSTFLWGWAGQRFGRLRPLMLAFLLQSVGVMLPLWQRGAWGAITGALLFGGTILGIVTLTLSLGRSLSPERPGQVMGILTLAFGLGQMLGPLVAGRLSDGAGNLDQAFFWAALTLVAGFLCLARGGRFQADLPVSSLQNNPT